MRKVEIEFVGKENTGCRQDSSGKGSPDDPEAAGDDNKHFRKLKANHTECGEQCGADPNCTGYEHNPTEVHCELWEVNIGFNTTATGFTCLRKTVKDVEVETPEPTPDSNGIQIAQNSKAYQSPLADLIL